MIPTEELLEKHRVLSKIDLKSKKKALETVASLLAVELDNEDVSEMDLLDALIARERLGATGLGHGVSLPHGRIKGLESPIGALITLNQGIDFEAPDDEPVDLMFGLVVPEHHDDDHLKILASLATLFANAETRAQLRKETGEEQLYSTFVSRLQTETGQSDESSADSQPDR